jgi:hypothetical protein
MEKRGLQVSYQKYEFYIKTETPITFYTIPTFIFRSVLGKNLRAISCLFKQNSCADCSLNKTCAYSLIFETPVEKDNEYLAGRNRAPHPLILSCVEELHKPVQQISFTVTLLGKSIEYFPYIYFALKQAGKKGVFKQRVPYAIEDVVSNGKSVIIDDETIDTSLSNKEWSLSSENTEAVPLQLKVNLLSPLRLKYGGKYGTDFNANDVLNAVIRRMQLLCGFYGSSQCAINQEELFLNGPISINDRNLRWQDYTYFSSRQKKKLRMGGALGDFSLSGTAPPVVYSLLHAAELFHVGKNPVFGFGKISAETN